MSLLKLSSFRKFSDSNILPSISNIITHGLNPNLRGPYHIFLMSSLSFITVAFRTLRKALNKYEALISPVLQPKCSQYAEYSVVLLLPRNSKSLGTA